MNHRFGNGNCGGLQAAEAIDESRDLIQTSKDMRGDVAVAVDYAEREEKRLHNSVNDALTQRLAETVTLMVSKTFNIRL